MGAMKDLLIELAEKMGEEDLAVAQLRLNCVDCKHRQGKECTHELVKSGKVKREACDIGV